MSLVTSANRKGGQAHVDLPPELEMLAILGFNLGSHYKVTKAPSKTSKSVRSFFKTEAKWSIVLTYAVPLMGLIAISLTLLIVWLMR